MPNQIPPSKPIRADEARENLNYWRARGITAQRPQDRIQARAIALAWEYQLAVCEGTIKPA